MTGKAEEDAGRELLEFSKGVASLEETGVQADETASNRERERE
jgi:hypothetical protein